MARIARHYMQSITNVEKNLTEGRFTNAEKEPVRETIAQIKTALDTGLQLCGASEPPPSSAPAAKETPLSREGVVFAQFNQSHISPLKGWGGPCTYCALQFILESFLSQQQKEQLQFPRSNDASDDVGQITARGAILYMKAKDQGTASFAQAYPTFKKLLEKGLERQIIPSQIAPPNAADFGIHVSDNPWQDAVNALDAEGDNVGAVITINGAHFHTYGLVKKEGKFTFYDSHGEPRLGEKLSESDGSPPAYTKTFPSKEALIDYLNAIRQVAQDKMVFVTGIDVSVVKLKGAD